MSANFNFVVGLGLFANLADANATTGAASVCVLVGSIIVIVVRLIMMMLMLPMVVIILIATLVLVVLRVGAAVDGCLRMVAN